MKPTNDDKAQHAHAQFRSAKLPIVTTTYILLECGNAAARRPYRHAVTLFRDVMVANDGLIVPTQDDWTDAWEAYDKGEAGQAGIVDQVSFVIMRRLGISQAFTSDWHFRAAGFETLF